MKYQANPVIVDAFVIVDAAPIDGDAAKPGQYNCALDNGENVVATPEICGHFSPKRGDYWVVQSDGYIYLNPKDVFERKYSAIQNEKGVSEACTSEEAA